MLDFIVNYNSILTHYVDTLSRWDYFVERYIFDHFSDNFGINETYIEKLGQFAKTRKILGWSEETNMLLWARDNFKESSKFGDLLPVIKYFESREDKAGESLNMFLSNKALQITNVYKNITDVVIADQRLNQIKKFQLLFNSEKEKKILPCFILYSPDTNITTGGANGDGIFFEVKDSDIDSGFIDTYTIIHELLHKRVNPHKLFINNIPEIMLNNDPPANVLNYYAEFTNYVEESLVYALSHIISDSIISPKSNIKAYSKHKQGDMVTIWKTVSDILPVLNDYIIGTSNIQNTRAKLVEYFKVKLNLILKS